MSSETIILQQATALVTNLRAEAKSQDAEKIEQILDDRMIWDKMVLRLRMALENLLEATNLSPISRLVAQELMNKLPRLEVNPYQELVYAPAKQLAKEIGERGHREWQSKVDTLISGSTSSTEIFMGLRWYLDEILRSEFAMPNELRLRATELRNKVHESLRIADGPKQKL